MTTSTKKIPLTLPEPLYDRLKEEAAKHPGDSMNAIAVRVLQSYFESGTFLDGVMFATRVMHELLESTKDNRPDVADLVKVYFERIETKMGKD